MFSLARSVLEQALLLDNLQHRTPDATRQRVAAKGAAMAAWGEQLSDGSAGQAGADGHAIAQAFGQGHHVRHDAFVLEGKPGAGAPDAGLDFVEHHQPAVARAVIAHGFQVAWWRHQHTTFTLDWFKQYRRDACTELRGDRLQGRHVAKPNLDEIAGQTLEPQAHRRPVAGGHGA